MSKQTTAKEKLRASCKYRGDKKCPICESMPNPAIAALEHVRTSAQTGVYEGGVVISFAAFQAVRHALGEGEAL
jgi:hypothetical protein